MRTSARPMSGVLAVPRSPTPFLARRNSCRALSHLRPWPPQHCLQQPAMLSIHSSSSAPVLHTRRQQRSPIRVAAAAGAYASGEYSYSAPSSPAADRDRVADLGPLPPPPSSATLAGVLPYLGRLALAERQLSWRVAVAFISMTISKIAGMTGPLLLKQAVDAMSAGAGLAAAVSAIVCYGLCGTVQHLAKELQHPMFTPISQAVSRRVAYHTFAHVLDLDIAFHLERRTGRLSRILERGTRSVQMLYRAVLFTFAPTALELVFVLALLATQFSPVVAALVGATFVVYVTWTLALTQMAVEVRKRVNTLDNMTSSKAVDALLNAETVALFNNQALEVGQYDHYLRGYQRAAIQTERLSAMLNAGQSVILTAGLTLVLIAAVTGGVGGAAGLVSSAASAATAAATASGSAASSAAARPMQPGDLVLIQGLLLQLWAPLQFLGWFYRELRQSLVDMEEYFDLLRTSSSLPSGDMDLPDVPPSMAAAAAAAAAAATAATMGAAPAAAAALPAGVLHAAHANGNGHNGNLGVGASAGISLSSSGGGGSGDGQDGSSSAAVATHGVASSDAGPSSGSSSSSSSSWLESGADAGAGDEGLWISGLGLEAEFKDVWFGYHKERQVLRGVSFQVAPGESVAVVGPSGSGKSTILKLLTRLYDAGAGTVSVNGVDVRQLRTQALRGAVAVVPQDTVLFNDTILQNIRYGRPGASDEDVMAAARLAHLDDAIKRMPEGYNTEVGERGLKLSGGEKQRVAIARAFLRAPRLLVCDEATSALDSATEASIMTSLGELAQGRTSVFVAHRLSTIKNCDRIIVLSAGRVAEEGTHEQLMAGGGMYRRMWEMQAAEARRPPRAGSAGAVGASVDGRSAPESSGEEDEDAPEPAAAMTPLPVLTPRAL